MLTRAHARSPTQAAICPAFVSRAEGRRFLACLLTVHPSMVAEMTSVIRNQVRVCSDRGMAGACLRCCGCVCVCVCRCRCVAVARARHTGACS
jgi:hypothetical protein